MKFTNEQKTNICKEYVSSSENFAQKSWPQIVFQSKDIGSFFVASSLLRNVFYFLIGTFWIVLKMFQKTFVKKKSVKQKLRKSIKNVSLITNPIPHI